MRFYDGAHKYLYDVSRKDVHDQCLYLVPEFDNKHDMNAVMLHNGQQKIGSVSANDAAKIKRLMLEWKADNGPAGEDVIVCKCDVIYGPSYDFDHKGSVTVRGMYRVNERLARKYSNLKLKRN